MVAADGGAPLPSGTSGSGSSGSGADSDVQLLICPRFRKLEEQINKLEGNVEEVKATQAAQAAQLSSIGDTQRWTLDVLGK